MNQPAPPRIEVWDAWLALIIRYTFAIGGLFVLGYNLRYMHDDPVEFRIVVALLAAAMMGRVIGATFAEIIGAWKKGGPNA